MSGLYRKILKQIEEAKFNLAQILDAYDQNRATITARGDTAYEPFQARITALFLSITSKIKELGGRLPDVTKNPKYSSMGEGQIKVDRAFDRFLKSFLVPDRYLEKRGFDLEDISALWQQVLDDEKVLADLLELKLLKGKKSKFQIKSQLETGKIAKRTAEKEQEDLRKEIGSLKHSIEVILAADFGSVSTENTKIILNWTEQWQERLDKVFTDSGDQKLETLKVNLQRMLSGIEASRKMLEDGITHLQIVEALPAQPANVFVRRSKSGLNHQTGQEETEGRQTGRRYNDHKVYRPKP